MINGIPVTGPNLFLPKGHYGVILYHLYSNFGDSHNGDQDHLDSQKMGQWVIRGGLIRTSIGLSSIGIPMIQLQKRSIYMYIHVYTCIYSIPVSDMNYGGYTEPIGFSWIRLQKRSSAT